MIDKARLTTLRRWPALGGTMTALAVLGMAVPAAAEEVSSGNDKVSLALSGQINRAVSGIPRLDRKAVSGLRPVAQGGTGTKEVQPRTRG